LNGNVEGWGIESLENDLGHLLAIRFWVDGGFGEQDWVFLGRYAQLVVEGVVPDLLHVIPVGNDTMFDRVSQSENTTLRLCLITDVGVLLTHGNHNAASCQLEGSTGAITKWRKVEQLTRDDEDDRQWMLKQQSVIFDEDGLE